MAELQIVESANASKTRIQGVTGPERNRRLLRFIKAADNELYLPVESGQEFGVVLTNEADHMVAYPTYLGRDGQRLCNTYAERQEDDPNDLPADGGMSEAGEKWSGYDKIAIDSMKLPGNRQEKFVSVAGGEFNDIDANQLLIYRRTRPGVTIAQVLGSTASGTRGGPSGPVIGTAQMTSDGRQLTGLDYERDAADPIFSVTIVSPDQAADMVDQAGLEPPQSWEYGRY